MNITIHVDFDPSYDGINGEMTYKVYDVEDLTALSQFYTSATQAMGFTYVSDVGFRKDKDEGIVWGGF